MNQMKKQIILLALIVVASTVFAQHDHSKCGMSISQQQLMRAKFAKSELSKLGEVRGDKRYIPVKFHLVAKSDGTGRIRQNNILRQLCKLNSDYADTDFVFYLKDSFDFSFIDNTKIYEAPGSNSLQINSKKVNDAVNIFVCNTANTGNPNSIGTTLGYYNPTYDFIVIRQEDVRDTTNTLSHEAGHFFSLMHTFFGWEQDPYDKSKHGEQIDFVNAPGTNIKVEMQNGNNCQNAADGLCDTPPDYNFGITAGSCRFLSVVKDINGDTVKPMINNQMSYFGGCDGYQFTPDQIGQMQANYGLSIRDYLKSSYEPNEDAIEGIAEFSSPTFGEKIETHNSVTFNWNAVPGATYYLLEISKGGEYYYHYTRGLTHIETRLSPKSNYSAKIIPFNDASTCLPEAPTDLIFRTGEQTTSTFDLEDVSALNIYPNPITAGEQISIDFISEGQQDFLINLSDVTGKIVTSQSIVSQNGSNHINISTNHIEKGIYVVTLRTNKGSSSRRVVIQ